MSKILASVAVALGLVAFAVGPASAGCGHYGGQTATGKQSVPSTAQTASKPAAEQSSN